MKFVSFKLYLENLNIKNDSLSEIRSKAIQALGSISKNLEINAYGDPLDVYKNKSIEIELKIKVPADQSDEIKYKLENILDTKIFTSYGFKLKGSTPFHWLAAKFQNFNNKLVYSYLVYSLTQKAAPFMAKDAWYFLDQGIEIDEFGARELDELQRRAEDIISSLLQIPIGSKDVQELASSVVNQFMDYADEKTGIYKGPIKFST